VDARLYRSTTIVEVPDSGCRESQVGYPAAVDVPAHREQRRWRVVLVNEASRHHGSAGLRPAMAAVLVLCTFPARVGSLDYLEKGEERRASGFDL
jgi:hypothetical protein